MEIVYDTLKCERCGNNYTIKHSTYINRKYHNRPNLCKDCMKIISNENRINSWKNKSKKDMDEFKEKQKEIWKNKSEEEKKEHSERTKQQLASRTKEEQEEINKKNSEGLKKHWLTVSKENKAKRVQGMRIGNKQMWNNMTEEEKHGRSLLWLNKLTPDEREKKLKELSERMKEYNDSLSLEEKQRRVERMQDWHRNLSDEQKRELYERTHRWYYNLSEEEKINYSRSKRIYWKELPTEIRASRIKKSLSAQKKNSLCERFEILFNNSYISNKFYFKDEVEVDNVFVHSWDYGIYNKSDNELVMVVDLDGEFYHGDKEDYNGMQSKEEYDEIRPLTIPKDVKYIIIQEKNFSKCFDLMIKELIMDYDEFINLIFETCRSIPFPYPRYFTKELLDSYSKLCNMNCNDKYHQDISLNTRLGDRIIQHFHESIYHAHRKDDLSPYDAWYNDDLLRKVIGNRIIYQSYLNPNKILQGFNISKVATKVSVFSAGRAKLIINKYLSEYDEIFDPFSGFSGRMLGSVSLGKNYIGQDISEIHVRESNEIISFLSLQNVSVTCKDILTSTGEYDCLFTCPPYSDKEQWIDTPVDSRSCDDWIDICLDHFKCNRYVFVVDYTEKYKDKVKYELINRSHINSNSEYIVVI